MTTSVMRRVMLVSKITTKCIEARCHACDTPIWVPHYDYSEVRNYCYTCAMSRLGEIPNGARYTREKI